MKIDGGIIFFMALFAAVIAVSVALGNYDPITMTVPRAQTAMTIGTTATNWVEAGLRWLIGLAIGGICMGIGSTAFREMSEAYQLWKRNAQAGRWQSGPNAQFQQKPPQSPRWTRQDKLLLAMFGRSPMKERTTFTAAQSDQDDDRLNIEM